MPERARIPLFLTLAFSLSWGWWLLLLAQGLRVAPGSTASHLPGLMGPMLAALATEALTSGRPGLRRLWRRIVRRPERPLVAVAAIVAPPFIAAATLLVLRAAGRPLPEFASFMAYPGAVGWLGGPIALAFIILLNGYGEEIGWRGWLFLELAPRLGAFRATLAVAAVWALWHLPLFWLNASMSALLGPMLIGWLAGLVLGAFALSWLMQTTGSVTVLAIWHIAYNLSVATPATAGTVAATVSTSVMVWGAWVGLIWWRQPPRIATT